MEKLESTFNHLQNSINSSKIDFQLLQNLKQQILSFHLARDYFLEFVKLMTQVYELSNNEKLYKIKRNSICVNEMAIQLKIVVCKILTSIIQYFEKQESFNEIPLEILSEAVQIMIICARVCLNQGNNKYISLIQQFYKFVHSPFDLVATSLKNQSKFFHQINVLELMRFKCDNQTFSVVEFQKRLSQVVECQEYSIQQYKNFVESILMEIILKSIKTRKLKPTEIRLFYPYLSEQNQNDLNFLIFDTQGSIKNIQSGSQFLQIYRQVKQNSIDSINIEFLEDFIKNEKNFNDERVFEIAALTLQPMILELWFNIFNIRKQKSSILQKAITCFIHIVDSIMHNNKYPKKQTLQGILKLSNAVTFAMLTEKKSTFTGQPILHIIKTFVKVLTYLCFELHEPWNQIQDFGQRTVLLCSRHQCMEVVKVIYSVMVYYCLVKRIKSEKIYESFVAHHSNEKSSQIYKFISSAYEIQNSGQEGLGDLRIDQALKAQMRKRPFVAILFAQKNQDMTIFQIEISQYKQLRQKFYIYAEILKKYRKDEAKVVKILSHLQDFLIKTNIEEFQSYMKVSEQQNIAIQQVFLLMIEILQEKETKNFLQENKIQQNAQKRDVSHLLDFLDKPEVKNQLCENQSLISSQINFILINLYIMGNQIIAQQFKELGLAIYLNKYSTKIKLINVLGQSIKNGTIQLDSQIYHICCSYLISVLEKFKIISIKKERIGQPGETLFVHAVAEFIDTFHQVEENKKIKSQDCQIDKCYVSQNIRQTQPSSENIKMKRTFITLTIFQIHCITNNWQKYLRLIDKLPIEVLKTFTHSVYIPKVLKQKIFRKVIKQNFTQAKCDISLKEFKEIIEITDDPEEVYLYIQYVFSTFGEEGRRMVTLIANQNKKIQKVLLKEKDIQL